MSSKKTKVSKPRQRIAFDLLNVFPADDLLGIDLLRLMAGHNDMNRVISYQHAHERRPTDPLAREIDDSRSAMEWRLLIAFLHETLKVIPQMERLEDFPQLESLLSNEGREGLRHLREAAATGSDPNSSPRFLEWVRNKAAFHFIRTEFCDALKEAKGRKDFLKTGFIIEGAPDKGRMHFSPADSLRNVIAFGIKDAAELNKELQGRLEAVVLLSKHLNAFLHSALLAYMTLRNISVQRNE